MIPLIRKVTLRPKGIVFTSHSPHFLLFSQQPYRQKKTKLSLLPHKNKKTKTKTKQIKKKISSSLNQIQSSNFSKRGVGRRQSRWNRNLRHRHWAQRRSCRSCRRRWGGQRVRERRGRCFEWKRIGEKDNNGVNILIKSTCKLRDSFYVKKLKKVINM